MRRSSDARNPLAPATRTSRSLSRDNQTDRQAARLARLDGVLASGQPWTWDYAVRPVFAALGWDREHLVALFFNAQARAIGAELVATGTADRVVFSGAHLELAASRHPSSVAVVMIHNHTTTVHRADTAAPSAEDLESAGRTRLKMARFGLEHIGELVLTEGGDFVAYSFRRPSSLARLFSPAGASLNETPPGENSSLPTDHQNSEFCNSNNQSDLGTPIMKAVTYNNVRQPKP